MPQLGMIYVDDEIYRKLLMQKDRSKVVQDALRRYFDLEVE